MPDRPRLATTDFYQVGASANWRRFYFSTDTFLIDHSNEQVYIPDHGSFEFKGPSRAYGYEAKSSVDLTSHLSLNGGLTEIANAFFAGASIASTSIAPRTLSLTPASRSPATTAGVVPSACAPSIITGSTVTILL
jgi:hypothetical protein